MSIPHQQRFIRNWLEGETSAFGLDIYSTEFHDQFTAKFGGARNCRTNWEIEPNQVAMKRLREMEKQSILTRWRVTVPDGGRGVPKWYYTYKMKH